ncbi:winged helix-turn-helix transcriptional regulator [Vibrio parahaemolyticus]|uniref:winged helix-turn-helix transcriptional regulator n=1 Tax=Vibrio parahaemolyticus TaxID=670 RepID=UPI000C797856|nr:helix-turn-helix domain-containing protein [Vibrio parahaemolyticus]PLR57512.1 transcriptional regulator [Vibrio parahaemolyticus]
METPLPKKNVRGSTSGVGIMAAFDLLGTKWNMRILWELRSKPMSFRGIQSQCNGMSPSVLNSRIKQLSEAKLIYISEKGYQLTELGYSLMQTLDPLRDWASSWEDALQQ